ncbi:Protein of unknown function (DUF3616) [Thiorhodovibrio frisius]|uniref:DUF3616 domain-containing protein n=2 Tax=Thiorhodovibrio frisius TaxID=631362 RepID=H8Z4L0_9GAMM|nr:DUF3616 domain-containing protein [Thiorhodovibrio frisius]EIC20267.1 Protein of unknown function (DUF3616) [Thiorhodovibrio frisius]WPL21004.1 hypothetical protein Thiofri_01111 [Thiorhodovibrio frisius]
MTDSTDSSAGADTTDSTAQGDAMPAGDGKKHNKGDAVAAGRNTNGKKKGSIPSKAAPQTLPVGSAKGIETLFRNAYRAELEIIALAATKANIMISLNGFIASALMISGAFIFASSPEFMVPAAVFLCTSVASIYFALLAASPDMRDRPRGIFAWLTALFKREASLQDFKAYVRPRRDFVDGESNILIYEERVKLSKSDYWERMRALLNDKEDVYAKMSDQLYWLGQMASRKFKLLNISYNVFRWGLIVSVLAFIGVDFYHYLRDVMGSDPAVRLRNLGIAQFEDIYEPSAVQQLPDGRILVVEDEPDRTFSITRFVAGGLLTEDPMLDLRLMRDFPSKPNDLEGLSMDADGYIYAITSHSRDTKGRREPSREQLLRFRIVGDNAFDPQEYTDLIEQLRRSPVLQQTLSQYTDQPVDFSDINIEGLTFDQSKRGLFIGFREPVVDGQSMIVKMDNPQGIFELGEEAHFSAVALLDLQGGGIRALTYDPILGRFLMVNEISGYQGNPYSQLWSWSGEPEAQPVPIALPEIINLHNVEAIASVTVNGESRLLMMSDEGSVKKGIPANYMLLEYGQLSAD